MSPIQISRDSNFVYLPLMYFLPEHIIAKFSTLKELPRKFREILYSPPMTEIVNSEQFLNEIMDSGAGMVFPHFGFRGWKEHYTGDNPVWQLSYAIPLWCQLLEKEIGWNLQALINIPSKEEIPFFTKEYSKEVMGKVVQRAIHEQGWQPILDVVRQMPCDEDFEKWDTYQRRDFDRYWYHTRSKHVKMISLEECMKDEENGIHELEDPTLAFEDGIVGKIYLEQFMATLSERDLEILELRAQGFPYEKIAERMGYKNHSGVIKRVNKITKAFIKFEEEMA